MIEQGKKEHFYNFRASSIIFGTVPLIQIYEEVMALRSSWKKLQQVI